MEFDTEFASYIYSFFFLFRGAMIFAPETARRGDRGIDLV